MSSSSCDPLPATTSLNTYLDAFSCYSMENDEVCMDEPSDSYPEPDLAQVVSPNTVQPLPQHPPPSAQEEKTISARSKLKPYYKGGFTSLDRDKYLMSPEHFARRENAFPSRKIEIQKPSQINLRFIRDFSRNRARFMLGDRNQEWAKTLILSVNHLTCIPGNYNIYSQYSQLTTLDLSSNRFTTLPDLSSLTQLTTVCLADNKFNVFPEALFALHTLTDLDLSQNSLKSIPEGIAGLSSLRSLNLFHNSFASFPEALTKCSSLQTLLLSENKIGSLPDNFGTLTSLRHLFLQETTLKELPSSIGQLARLENLVVDCNQLCSLPSQIGNLSKLRLLSASHNVLINLPEELFLCTEMERLNLAVNRLTAISPCIGKLKNLIQFSVEENPLSLFPQEIHSLPHLKKCYTLLSP